MPSKAMHNIVGLAIAALLIGSSASTALAAPRHTSHSNYRSHGYSAQRPGTVPVVPYSVRNAFGAVAAPTIGQDCSLRPFARDCDKRGPW